MVRKTIDITQPLTETQKKMLEEAHKKPLVFDEDSPELTEEELCAFRRVLEEYERDSQKQTITLRLSPQAVKRAKALGKGYTSILSRVLENALRNPETLSRSLRG